MHSLSLFLFVYLVYALLWVVDVNRGELGYLIIVVRVYLIVVIKVVIVVVYRGVMWGELLLILIFGLFLIDWCFIVFYVLKFIQRV